MLRKLLLIAIASTLLGFGSPGLALSGGGGDEEPRSWLVRVVVSYGYDTKTMLVGGNSVHTDGFDNSELRSLAGKNLEAYFLHEDWARGSRYASDLRSLNFPQEYGLNVKSRYRAIKISWDLTYAPETVELKFIDPYMGVEINMRNRESYSYNNPSRYATKTFNIVATGFIDNGEELDTVPPETEITTELPEFIASDSVTIEYTGSDNVTSADALRYSYRLDEGAWSSLSTETAAALDALADGLHTFEVKAIDEAGNEDPTPAAISFSVDTTPPDLQLASPDPSMLWPPNNKITDVGFSGTAVDSGSGLATISYALTDEYLDFAYSGEASFDGASSFGLAMGLEASRDGYDPDGRVYTFIVTATDNVGNSIESSVYVIVPHDMRDKYK